MRIETPPSAWFRRGEFHGRFKVNDPKWHVLESGDRSGTLTAICGFQYRDTLMDAKISKAKSGPRKTDRCVRCEARLS